MGLNLEDVRIELLNPDLGLASDGLQEPWGTETVRVEALVNAIDRMWPRMGRLILETVPIVAGADYYELGSIWDLEVIEVRDSSGMVYKELSNWRNWLDVTDPDDNEPVKRVVLPVVWKAGTSDTLRAIGFRPYTTWEGGGG